MAADDDAMDLGRAIEAAREGDPGALFAATERLRPYLEAVARAVLKGRLAGKVDPADVVQQSLLASVERFAQFEGETPAELQRWLVAIVRNEAKNLLRYWHQDKRLVAAEDAVAGSRAIKPTDDGASTRLPAGEPSPSRLVAAREEASRMLATLDRLPSEQRTILTLRHFEGLSHAEIAERLGRTPDAIRQAWVRALRSLRRALGDTA